jgi:conjugative transfer signal peptidase TraF
MSTKTFGIVALTAALIIPLVAALAAQGGWWLNASNSAPLGLWRVTSSPVSTTRHQWVVVCPPTEHPAITTAKARGYVPPGPCPGNVAPLIKQVAAVPGDTVQLTRHGLHVNGQLLPHTRPLLSDGHERPLPVPITPAHRVAPAVVWLVSGTARARGFDSRYFGAVSSRQVLGVARLVWGWGTPSNAVLVAPPGR